MVKQEVISIGLDIKNVVFNYGSHRVLNQITIDVKPGEVLAVIGPNGSGKSTLVRMASGILHPGSGTVKVQGINIHEENPDKRARLISVVPQAVKLPESFNAADTVLMGRTPYIGWFRNENKQDLEITRRAMERTNTISLSERMIGELSGGEQQRVLIARALAQSTPVILMDEPTAHLDLKYQSNIMGLIQSLAKKDGLAVLVILHDLNLASIYADRVVLLVNGGIYASGLPAEVLNASILSSAYQVPVNVISHPIYNSPLILPDGKDPV